MLKYYTPFDLKTPKETELTYECDLAYSTLKELAYECG